MMRQIDQLPLNVAGVHIVHGIHSTSTDLLYNNPQLIRPAWVWIYHHFTILLHKDLSIRWDSMVKQVLTIKTKFRLAAAIDAAQIAPEICQGQPPTMYSRVLPISSKSVHFRRSYIAKRVNTAKTRRNVNPRFGRSIYSSRVINGAIYLVRRIMKCYTWLELYISVSEWRRW